MAQVAACTCNSLVWGCGEAVALRVGVSVKAGSRGHPQPGQQCSASQVLCRSGPAATGVLGGHTRRLVICSGVALVTKVARCAGAALQEGGSKKAAAQPEGGGGSDDLKQMAEKLKKKSKDSECCAPPLTFILSHSCFYRGVTGTMCAIATHLQVHLPHLSLWCSFDDQGCAYSGLIHPCTLACRV